MRRINHHRVNSLYIAAAKAIRNMPVLQNMELDITNDVSPRFTLVQVRGEPRRRLGRVDLPWE